MKSRYLFYSLALMLIVPLITAACATSNPYRYASTVLDRAHVTLRLVEEAQATMLPVLSDAAIPETVKAHLRSTSRAATLAAEQLGKAVIEVEAARAELATANGGDARLRVANARLLEWIATLKERIAGIKSAVKEVHAL